MSSKRVKIEFKQIKFCGKKNEREILTESFGGHIYKSMAFASAREGNEYRILGVREGTLL